MEPPTWFRWWQAAKCSLEGQAEREGRPSFSRKKSKKLLRTLSRTAETARSPTIDAAGLKDSVRRQEPTATAGGARSVAMGKPRSAGSPGSLTSRTPSAEPLWPSAAHSLSPHQDILSARPFRAWTWPACDARFRAPDPAQATASSQPAQNTEPPMADRSHRVETTPPPAHDGERRLSTAAGWTPRTITATSREERSRQTQATPWTDRVMTNHYLP